MKCERGVCNWHCDAVAIEQLLLTLASMIVGNRWHNSVSISTVTSSTGAHLVRKCRDETSTRTGEPCDWWTSAQVTWLLLIWQQWWSKSGWFNCVTASYIWRKNNGSSNGPHQLLSSSMRSRDDSEWPVHSLMLSLHDLQGLPLQQRFKPSVPCSTVIGSASYRQTLPNNDNLRRLQVDNKIYWRPGRHLSFYKQICPQYNTWNNLLKYLFSK